MTIGNSKNNTSRNLTDAKYKNKMYAIKKYEGWYADYLKDDSAQWKMTFFEYKKHRIKSERIQKKNATSNA